MSDEVAPAFPNGALAMAMAAMVLVAAVGIGVNWFVGERVKTIANSQIEVLASTQEVAFLSQQKERAIDLAIATGETGYLEESVSLQLRLQESLGTLERAIELEQNRATFRDAFASENQLRAVEARQFLLVAEGRLDEARALNRRANVAGLRDDFLHRIDEIEMRSQRFVSDSQGEVSFWLRTNLVGNALAILLIAATMVLLLRRTRSWARHVQRMEQEARAAEQAKADFLATMSHEIRTPLNGVIGFADMLSGDPSLGDEQRRKVGLIQSAGAMLLTVVNDVLDFSRLEAERFELDLAPFSLAAVMDQSVSIMRPMAEEKGLSIAFEIDPALDVWHHGDCDRLRQVVLNLLNNAVKFTHRGGVTLAVRQLASDAADERFEIVVRDTGIGIPAARVKHLFEPFTQADSGIAKQYGGSGLGLSICRRLIELMGGTITLASTEGMGSTFTVTLQLPRAVAPAVGVAGATGKARSARILLVEDLPMNREIALAMLARGEHAVQCAESGEQALMLASTRDFDLVLMDIQMPGIDGVEATRRIRALPGPRGQVPILAMTANTLPQQVRAYREAGMAGHVAKPLRQAELDNTIEGALGEGGGPVETAPTAADGVFDATAFDTITAIMPHDKLAGHIANLDALVRSICQGEVAQAELEAAAHKIGSQAGALGLVRLMAAARELERSMHEGDDAGTARQALVQASSDIAQFVAPRLERAAAA